MALREGFKLNYSRLILALLAWAAAFAFGAYLGRYLRWFADFLLAVPIGLMVYLLTFKPFRNLRRERIRCLNCGRRFTIKIPVNNFITGFARGDSQPSLMPNERSMLITHKRCGKSMYVLYRETPPMELLVKGG